MILPVRGDINKITARYFQFGDSPYSFQAVNPDGSLFPKDSNGNFRHHGMDLDVPEGTPIYAPEAGTVLFSGPAGTAGNMVRIKGATGIVRMLHNRNNVIGTGASVKQGQLVAYSGETGQSAGIPHVHFDLERGGKYVNARPYIKEKQMLTLKIAHLGSRIHFGRAANKYTIDKYVGKIGADEWLEKAENSDEAKARARLLKKAKTDLNNHLPSAAR